ncbi:UbiH/UbiF family hydroxylase [Coralliovum pocilloporae]|uniref:UbiH/UbiF family hydroxylase n=1 Tax=Coralliovum pocilloporae TaxID=3066369 RepID=UPI0033072826
MGVYDVAVSGGGPAGLITALGLAKNNYRVALIAPQAPVEDERTTALLAGSVSILKDFDAWDEIAPHAAPLRIMRILDGTARLIRAPSVSFDSAEIGLEAFGYNIRNRHLVEALRRLLKDHDAVDWLDDWTESLDIGANGVRLTLRSGKTVEAHLVAGADGRRSPARDAAGIGIREWSYDQCALVLNLEHTEPHFDMSTEFHTETGPFTLVPLDNGLSSLVCVVRPEDADRLANLSEELLIAELEQRGRSVLGQFKLASPVQTYPLSGMTAERFGTNRIALIGEAGHVFPPIGAQGLNLGIRDIADLIKALSLSTGDAGAPHVLEAFDRKRQSDVKTRTNGVHMLNRSLLTDFLPVQFGRSAGLALARSVGPLRRFMMREGVEPGLGVRSLVERLTERKSAG